MGSSLTPVLANIILTEFEKVAVTPLMKNGILQLIEDMAMIRWC